MNKRLYLVTHVQSLLNVILFADNTPSISLIDNVILPTTVVQEFRPVGRMAQKTCCATLINPELLK